MAAARLQIVIIIIIIHIFINDLFADTVNRDTATKVQESADGRRERVAKCHEGMWGGMSPPYTGMGLGKAVPPSQKIFVKNYQNSAFSWHLRKFCWPFYVLFLRCNC